MLSLGECIAILIVIIVLAVVGPDFFVGETEGEFYGVNADKDPRRNPHYDE